MNANGSDLKSCCLMATTWSAWRMFGMWLEREDEVTGFCALLRDRAKCGESALSLVYKTGSNA
jgi:hypothetical protein